MIVSAQATVYHQGAGRGSLDEVRMIAIAIIPSRRATIHIITIGFISGAH
jgi:hypothetical protein